MKRCMRLVAALLALLLSMPSCVSLQIKTNLLSEEEMANVNVIGDVKTEFVFWYALLVKRKKSFGKKAYKKLKEEAMRKYATTDVDVINVYAYNTTWRLADYHPFILFTPLPRFIAASGDVISTTPKTDTPTGLEEALKKASSKFINTLPGGSKIAVVYIEAEGAGVTSLVINEVEFHLVSSNRFTVVDRSTLDLIRNEQNLHMSGAVNDADVVRIGELSGANVVITGAVTKTGDVNRLSLKALDVKTGQIITMARGPF